MLAVSGHQAHFFGLKATFKSASPLNWKFWAGIQWYMQVPRDCGFSQIDMNQ